MTLGRTSSGAIKIKTDTAGGGLRAVECACCGCPCNYGGSKKLKFQNLIGAQITGDHQYFCNQINPNLSVYILQAPISTGGLLVFNIVCNSGQKEILVGANSTDPSVSCGYSGAVQLSANPEHPLLGTWTTTLPMCGYYEPCEEDTDTGCWVSVDCGSVGCIDITVDIVESDD